MSRMERVVVVMRSACDLRGPLETASWISRVSGASLTVMVRPGFRGGCRAVEIRFRELEVPSASRRVITSSGKLNKSVSHELAHVHGAQLVVAGAMECGPDSAELLDPETVEFIEAISQPVLLFPFRRVPALPWSSIVTPMSGEIRRNRALSRAIELANQLHVPIDIIHVLDPAQPELHGALSVGKFGDQAHHELHAMIDEFISDACPYCSKSEKRVIRNFHLVHGKATEELLKVLSGSAVGLLAIEWKGSFMEGHAETLKTLIRRLRIPVLLVRQSPASEVQLRAGHRLAA